MNVAEWILVTFLSITLLVFLIVGIILLIKLIRLADEAQKIVMTGQGIAAKADDIVDNVKGMTSVGGIVKTFASRIIENQQRRYAEEDAARASAEAEAKAAAEQRAADEAIVREAIARMEAERIKAEGEGLYSEPKKSKLRKKLKTKKKNDSENTQN